MCVCVAGAERHVGLGACGFGGELLLQAHAPQPVRGGALQGLCVYRAACVFQCVRKRRQYVRPSLMCVCVCVCVQCEDERFEIDMVIDSNTATIRVLEPLAEEIAALKGQEEGEPVFPEVGHIWLGVLPRVSIRA